MKKTLPSIRFAPIEPLSPLLGKRLENWMIERALDIQAREVSKYEPAPDLETQEISELSSHVTKFDPGAKAGDIRLLSSSLTPSASRPVYVAVFRDWQDDEESGSWKLIAPFGPYTEPATRTELFFSERQPSLQVLSLWNTHSVPVELLDRSWLVDRLTDEELQDAWGVFRYSIAGVPLPEGLLDRVGSPIRDPRDPRHDYQFEEISHLSRVANLAQESLENLSEIDETSVESEYPAISLTSIWEEYDRRGLLLAADSNPPLSASEEFQVVGSDLLVKFYLEADRDKTTVTVFDPDGELSQKLDGSMILGTSGAELGLIKGGFSTISTADLKNGILVRSSSGQIVELIRRP